MQNSILLGLLLAGVMYTSAQYNYAPPPPPANKYLPPPPATYLPPTTPRPVYVTEKLVAAVYNQPEPAHAPGMPYDFTYSVKDAQYGNDYGRSEQSDGDVVRGEYRTLMPDGRMQIVRYTADWKNGYRAQVSYEGQVKVSAYSAPRPQPQRFTSGGYRY